MPRLTSAEYAKRHGAAAGKQLHRERMAQFRSQSSPANAIQRVAHVLAQTPKRVQRAVEPKTGPLTRSQAIFRDAVARRTGLHPAVVGAWVNAEMGGKTSSAAQAREKARNYNWLNIAYYDKGPGKITKDKTWKDPHSAADATADFLQGKRFGPSEGIKRIVKMAKQPPEKQIQAIVKSGWATDPYNNGDNLRDFVRRYPRGY